MQNAFVSRDSILFKTFYKQEVIRAKLTVVEIILSHSLVEIGIVNMKYTSFVGFDSQLQVEFVLVLEVYFTLSNGF